jgi:hypothetical protein
MKEGQLGGDILGKIKQRVRTVRAVPQITLGRNRTKNGPKKSSAGAEVYIKTGERLGGGVSAWGKGVLGEPSQSPMRPRVPQEPKKLGLRSLKWKRKNRVSRCRREILRGLDKAIGTVVTQEGRGGCGQEGTSHYRREGEREVPFLVLAANRQNKRQKFVVHATVPGKKTKKG